MEELVKLYQDYLVEKDYFKTYIQLHKIILKLLLPIVEKKDLWKLMKTVRA